MNVVKGYDDIKHKVLESHDSIYNDYNHIKTKCIKRYLEIYFKCKDSIYVSKKFSCKLYVMEHYANSVEDHLIEV